MKYPRFVKLSVLSATAFFLGSCSTSESLNGSNVVFTDFAVHTSFGENEGVSYIGFSSLEDTKNHALTQDNHLLSIKSHIGYSFFEQDNGDKKSFYTITLPLFLESYAIQTSFPQSDTPSKIDVLYYELSKDDTNYSNSKNRHSIRYPETKISDGKSTLYLPIIRNNTAKKYYARDCDIISYNTFTSQFDVKNDTLSYDDCLKEHKNNDVIPLFKYTSILSSNNIYFDWAIKNIGETERSVVTIQKDKIPLNNTKLNTQFPDIHTTPISTSHFVFYFDNSFSPIQIIEYFIEDTKNVSFDGVILYKKYSEDKLEHSISSLVDFNALITGGNR